METLNNLIKQNPQENGASEKPKRNSKDDGRKEAFMKKFPTTTSLKCRFSPKSLGYYLSEKERTLNEYSPNLHEIDIIYGEGTSTEMLTEMYLSVYRLSTIKEPFTMETATQAASLFFGSYRKNCNLYQMMLYFAMYPTMFKSSYFQFDTTDILRQYGAKFMPWYQSQTTEDEQTEPAQARTTEPRGIEARDIYLREQIRKGADVRQGGLYRFGFVSEYELQRLEMKVYS